MERTKVFISYSHKDRQPMERLKVFIRRLEREKKLDPWDDTKILPGENWREKIADAIAACKVAVLFISIDFVASDFIDSDELPPLLKAANEDGAVILSIFVGPIDPDDYKSMGLEKFQAINDPDKPLIDLPRNKKERVFLKASKTIKTIINQRRVSPSSSDRRISASSEDAAFKPAIEKPPAPRFLAEFYTDSAGKIRTYGGGGRYTHYEIRLFLENAPSDTEKVVYELHDSYPKPIREVRSDKLDFGERITSYGDYVVNIDIVGTDGKVSEITGWLSQALGNFYGENASEEISQAIKQIKKF